MDIKIHGLTRPIVEEAIAEPEKQDSSSWMSVCQRQSLHLESVGKYAPKIIRSKIDPAKIGDVVGQRGKTINEIVERTGVKIDITDEGNVSVCGTDKEKMDEAVEMIEDRHNRL